ncbi:hypothetical protein BDF20DRAFT_928092 [Mycotypha africana]|uniref:uncharacterized protein n=1 Tax=Mycotypha africana TaxID=64632 RepID=UPI0023002CC7|nr:uncharacterized protein BDF20DRAFT_928092 [Mycotypha africana]KAI8967647.1 hypothetical protein BDF20DRAFT_928092 [Mycotypha africana]
MIFIIAQKFCGVFIVFRFALIPNTSVLTCINPVFVVCLRVVFGTTSTQYDTFSPEMECKLSISFVRKPIMYYSLVTLIFVIEHSLLAR